MSVVIVIVIVMSVVIVMACAVAVRRRDRRALGERHCRADDGFTALLENPALARLQRAAAQREAGRRADDRMALPVVAESDRRGVGDSGRSRRFGQHAAIEQRDGLRPQVNGAQHQLRRAAGRADQEVEIVGRARAALAQGALLRNHRDSGRERQRNEKDGRERQETAAAQVGENDRQGIHPGNLD
jgi:hypothetical protein